MEAEVLGGKDCLSHDSNSSDNFKHRRSFPVTILVNMLVIMAVKISPVIEVVWKQEYQVEKIAIATTAIILNILSFPVTILMNVLVIMAVKTRPRLQNKYNILPGSL